MCILLPIWYGNPITKEKWEENKLFKTPSKWTYNLSIFNFILLHSYWNDKLEIWSMSSAIKSHSLKENRTVSTIVELYSHLPPLTYILCWLIWRKILYEGLSPGYGYFSGGSSEIQKDFLTPDFFLNCFFFLCFFLLFNKRILLLILLTQTQQFRVPFYCGELYLLKTLYLRGKASQLAVLIIHLQLA